MRPGEQFELDAIAYLNDNYADNDKIKFVGGDTADSTKSDIEAILSDRTLFFIEAKDTAAQSGQFVLLPNVQSQKFVFSPRNKSEPNEMTNMIIEYMNRNFIRYNAAGTAGEPICVDDSIFYDWIIEHYRQKGVKFFITKKHSFIIFPINRFPDYFEVAATYRIKKSGSGEPSKKCVTDVEQAIKKSYPSAVCHMDGKKLYAQIAEPISTSQFNLEQYSYRLSKKDLNLYEVRRLSNTYNMNVIFNIHVKKEQAPEDLLEFKKALGII